MTVQIEFHNAIIMAFTYSDTAIPMNTTTNIPATPAKKENLLVNLAFNIAIPSLILSKLSGEQYLGPTLGVIVALAFPFFYGLMDFRSRHKVNIFSILGLSSTLLTGTISLMHLPSEYIAIKEAAIPSIIFLAVLISTWTPYPLVEKLIFNEAIFNMPMLMNDIQQHQAEDKLKILLKRSSYLIASSFLISAILNYVLAKIIVVSASGTEAYNAELGKMALYSYPVIALPCTAIMVGALFYLMHALKKITGKDIEELLIIGKE